MSKEIKFSFGIRANDFCTVLNDILAGRALGCKLRFPVSLVSRYLLLGIWIRPLNSTYFIFLICLITMIFYISLQGFLGK